ncbi:MAG: D-aminoacyl-tRNA deacylase [Nanobdellota archaeon]
MDIAIVISKKDIAGINIYNKLKYFFNIYSKKFYDNDILLYNKGKNNLYLFITEKDSVYCEKIDDDIKEKTNLSPDIIIFATKHESKSNIHSLSCHTQGNWNNADYGGNEREISVCPTKFIYDSFRMMKRFNESEEAGYEVILECTHHGPFTKTPSAFIEIGSNEESWNNDKAGNIIAKTLIETLKNFTFELEKELPVAVGLGGLHHCPQFSKRIERDEAYISHVCPKYALDYIDEEMLKKAVEKSIPKASMILLDWKGIKENKDKIKELCNKFSEEYGIIIKKTKEFKSQSNQD